jgi:hypothetical protein
MRAAKSSSGHVAECTAGGELAEVIHGSLRALPCKVQQQQQQQQYVSKCVYPFGHHSPRIAGGELTETVHGSLHTATKRTAAAAVAMEQNAQLVVN